MFGYVREYPPELKLKHHVFYRAVYCGVCKSMGRCTGFCSRATLSYDMAFLALVRMALEKTSYAVVPQRCVLHPVKKHPILKENAALDYSARVSALLFHGKVSDNIADSRGAKRLLFQAIWPFAEHFRKKAGLEAVDAQICERLAALSALEKQACESVDQTAEIFGMLCADFFAFGLEDESETIARSLGKHIGRWIYAADALDDFERDVKSGAYNPFAALYGAALPESAKESVAAAMKNELVSAGKALDLIDFEDENIKTLVYHIVFEGMLRKTEELTHKKKSKGELR